MRPAIAIVGMACRYPDADSPVDLWRNVLSQRRAFRRIPAERLRAEDYLAADPRAPDRTYSAQAAVLEGWTFDRVRFRIGGNTFRATDLAHWLALEVAADALADAGWPEGQGLDRDRVGVLVGNTLTGEFSRADQLRLRWPYVRRVLAGALAEEGWSEPDRGRFLGRLEGSFKAPFASYDEDALAGKLSNTIAGRICNSFDLGGGGYTVDGACAASLLAVSTACAALETGDLDVALAGGVDLSLDPFELVGFAKVGALARSSMRVYDRRAEGFWPGEGCGFVVLQRTDDALDRGARRYASIRGWGVSSDGAGGLTRPEVEGQLRALRRAYARAGFGPASVDLFEGHGTGTREGDRVELTALSRAREEDGAQAAAAIGSIKANIGHTKAAAGLAGLIKAAMSLHERVIPPTTACEQPHDLLTGPDALLRTVPAGEAWPHARQGRAAVSGMGFGGINAHVVLEGIAPVRAKPAPSRTAGPGAVAGRRLSREQQLLLGSAQDAELLVFGASDRSALGSRIDAVRAAAAGLSLAEIGDLAVALQRQLPAQRCEARAALVASTPEELAGGLEDLAAWIEGEASRLDLERGVFLGFGDREPQLGFLFPGQASPTYLDGGALARRFPFLARVAEARALDEGDLGGTAVAQPAIVSSSVLGLAMLGRLGVHADVGVGHSLGELTALYWAVALEEDDLFSLAAARGRAMAELGADEGAMASIAGEAAEVEAMLAAGVVVAGYNGRRQTVVSGAVPAVEAVMERARDAGVGAARLPVSHAFHSPSMAPAAARLADVLEALPIGSLRRCVISTISGGELPFDADLRTLLVEQLTSPVRFDGALARAAERVDALVEVGPGTILRGLARRATDLPVVALDAGGSSLRPLLTTAGALFALGAPLRLHPLFADRFARPFSLDEPRAFLANPCERAPGDDGGTPAALAGADGAAPAAPPAAGDPEDADVLAVVRALVARRTELPQEAVLDGSRLLADLHLTSIAVGELAAEAARELGIGPLAPPTELANATVAELAAALEAGRSAAGGEPEPALPDGIGTWFHPFAPRLVESDRPPGAGSTHRWTVLVPDAHPLKEAIEKTFAAGEGEPAVLACLLPGLADGQGDLLLRAAAVAREQGARRCAFLQHGGGACGFAKALHLESSGVDTCVVDLPLDAMLLAEARRDAESVRGFSEVVYDAARRRRVPVLDSIELPRGELPLAGSDVLLVTGGGKGIGAECALGLARASGAGVMLIGRARPAQDAQLAENLRRFEDAGVRHRYLPADVTDAEALRAAVARGQGELGPVTGVLHASGNNIPARVENLDAAALRRTLAPKLGGLRNVLAALDRDRLRLLVTFGSIIGRIGLRGEAHYALANDLLAAVVAGLRDELPRCRCLNIEWSVWTGAGMGERLGTVAALAQEGITPIPIDVGVDMLERLVRAEGLPHSVVVAGRFGPPPTVALAQRELPMRRFLERTRVHYPGIELVCEAELSRGTDPYLDDHVLDGVALLPAVLGLEAMASAAQALTGEAEAPELSRVRFARPITVPADGARTIRLAALVAADGAVEVAIRSEETGFAVDHFSAACRFAPSAPSARPARAADGPGVELDPERELYGKLLFQGPRFRRLCGYRALDAGSLTAEVSVEEPASWFGSFLPQTLVLGDPGARDAVIHAVQACIPHLRLLPVGVERLSTSGWPRGRVTVEAHERQSDGETLVFDVVVSAATGEICERWEGLALRAAGPAPAQGSWPPALLAPYLERRLSELLGERGPTVAFTSGHPNGRRAAGDAAMARALRERVTFRRRPDGRPVAPGRRDVSAAHLHGCTLAVAGQGPVACDLEAVVRRSGRVWADLLGPDRLTRARLLADEADGDLDAAATRVWAAMECVKKAGLAVSEPLTLSAQAEDGWMLLHGARASVATFVGRVGTLEHPVAIGLLAGNGRR